MNDCSSTASFLMFNRTYEEHILNIVFLLYRSKSSNNGKNAQYISEDEFEFPKLIPLRAQTAPARPLTEIEEFRRSSDFLLLENTVMMSDHLKQRTDQKYDLDSEDG
jgi:hypothetical protein